MKRNPGSFRDPANVVYEEKGADGDVIVRGVNHVALINFRELRKSVFYKTLLDNGWIINTEELYENSDLVVSIRQDGWDGYLWHQPIPFISYPYEWSFSMLKDAALLQLDILELALENGWTLKDATPYNIQWQNSRPVFIDIPSFEPREEGTAWTGYNQFCSTFLIPLLLTSHLNINVSPLLRSNLEGISASEAINYFNGIKLLKPGVLKHIFLPSKIAASINKKELNNAPAVKRKEFAHSKAMVVGLVQSLKRLVKRLSKKSQQTAWSHYAKNNSYTNSDQDEKSGFIIKNIEYKNYKMIWDLGCNTGNFSRLVNARCEQVISVDGDHEAIDDLYLANRAKNTDTNILPLVINLANFSPWQGWAGKERAAFDGRKRPDLVMCLAVIHHICIGSNIPLEMFLGWLRSLDADLVLEFVSRDDEMVQKLLINRKDKFEGYSNNRFLEKIEPLFNIEDRLLLKDGKREIFALSPK